MADPEAGGIAFAAFLLALFVSVIAAGIIGFTRFTHVNPLSPNFVEQNPPEIRWKEEPVGIGADPVTFEVTFSDEGGGLDEVFVRLVNRNQSTELERRNVSSANVRDETVQFTIDPKKHGLREGNVEIQVAAFDKTLWSNGLTVSKIVQVNFSKPRLEVVTPEQNGVLGGSQLVFYKVLGKTPVSQGVSAGGTLYPGFPAKLWDPSMKSNNELYVALFPISFTFDESGDRMKITARDDIGNGAQAPFGYRIRHRRSSTIRTDLSAERAAQVAQGLSAFARDASLKIPLSGELISDVKVLFKELRSQDEGILVELLSRTDGQRWWQGPFGRPVSTYPSSTAGDIRVVSVAGTEVVKERMMGARFPVSTRSTVQAANAGRVAFVGSLGLLGETIVIDHGMGLSSIYGHLSDTAVKINSEVVLGQPIGRTGTSGFAQGEEVFFEIRLHGVPVSPNEWWDPSWVKDHVDNKTAFVRRTIGAPR